ncbi:hypothetical protein EPN44_12650 [bacterium]|nr:MAG: hypothetical protein EPN44_12650 [bacterium]
MNVGCIPTKALVRTAELIHLARRPENAAFGFTVHGVSVDFPQVIVRKDGVVADVVGRLTRSLEDAEHLNLIRGEARFTDARTIVLGDGRQLSAPGRGWRWCRARTCCAWSGEQPATEARRAS